jgi:hypothetical protein
MPQGTMRYGTRNQAGKDATTLEGIVRHDDTRGQQATLVVINDAATSDFGDPVAIDARGLNTGITTQGRRIGLNARGSDDGEFGVVAYGPVGIHASSSKGLSGLAGYFHGGVQVRGFLNKAGGGFKIDHPLDPENRYLGHSFVESSDALNVYSDNVVTDENGDATVTLPGYFAALNRDFRYQLTVVGQFAQAIVGEEISENRFTIKTDQPNVKVSWQVTGVRQDAFAKAHRIAVEEDKPPEERGTYLHPAEYGKPETLGVNYARERALADRDVYGSEPAV